jgi:hypothetical protein
MSGVDGVGLCTYRELKSYLEQRREERLLQYVEENNGRFTLVAEQYSTVKLPSVRYQIACVFMLLGEYAIAESIHQLRWSDLSSWGDKTGNDLLKHFMRAYPRQ